MKKGYVYADRVSEAQLKTLIERLSNPIVLSWNLARLDFSGELRDAGCAFDSTKEIRWTRDRDGFQVLILSDEETANLGLDPVGGNWTVRDNDRPIQLVDLRDRRFSPAFEEYPAVQHPRARLRCKIFLRNQVVMFVSPREVLSDERATS